MISALVLALSSVVTEPPFAAPNLPVLYALPAASWSGGDVRDVVLVDFDADGDTDLFLARGDGPDVLLLRTPDGFEPVDDYTLGRTSAPSNGAAFAEHVDEEGPEASVPAQLGRRR